MRLPLLIIPILHCFTIYHHRSSCHAFNIKAAMSNDPRHGHRVHAQPHSESVGSSSLTFVIDTTGSMYDDLVQVRQGYERIFDTVLSQPERVISNYVLVPFHDPDVGPAIVTEDVHYLRNVMANIDVQGGGDCPEMALAGIKLALERSLPSSFLYVFTDARAKDYHLLDDVLRLVQEKQSQVVFIMTGDCGDRTHPGYVAFETIASMSSGQIFHLDKSDVNKIIEYVRLSLMNKRVRIVAEDHEQSRTFEIQFPVDSHLFEVTVSIAGDRPQVQLIDPSGQPMGSETGARSVVQLSNVVIISVSDPRRGIWTLKGQVGGRHSIRVTGISDLDFTHGFSPYPQAQPAHTSYRPVVGIPSYLLINFTGLRRPGVALEARLLNARGETVHSQPLIGRPDDVSVYHVESFVAPDGNFYTMVTGVDELNCKFQRLSPTSICPTAVRRPPVVRMPPQSQVWLHQTATLVCQVDSSVPYTVYWYKNGREQLGGPLFYEKSEQIAWTLPTVGHHDGGRYTCAVTSAHGNASAETTLHVMDPPVRVRAPEVVKFPEHSAAHIHCFPEAEEMATITWQRRGEPLTTTDHMKVLNNGTLFIARIAKSDEGPYVCNVLTPRGSSKAQITVLVIERPTVTVHPKDVQLQPGQSFSIRCHAQGPEITQLQWLHNGRPVVADGRRVQATAEYIMVAEGQPSDQGRYECRASNPAGTASDTADVQLRDAPRIVPEEMDITATENETVTLECKTVGYPAPTLRWSKDGGADLDRDMRFSIDGEMLTLHKAERSDTGRYICVAENDVGKAVAIRRLTVKPPLRYIYTPCDEHGRAVKTVYVPARGDTPLLNRPMLPWDTEVIDFPTVNGTDNVFVLCLPPSRR